MKIRIASDFHAEHDLNMSSNILPWDDSDYETVLVVAGDLGAAGQWDTFLPFLDRWSHRFRAVVYVPGNHEFYGSRIDQADEQMKTLMAEYENVYYGPVMGAVHEIDGYNFICAPLFCDMGGSGATAQLIKRALMDFQMIRIYDEVTDVRYINEDDYRRMFAWNKNFIFNSMNKMDPSKTVVVTHWTPSYQSVPERFKGSPINGGFSSDLDEDILFWEPALWVHGHTHNFFDYNIGDTRICCNPMGYAFEYTEFDPYFRVQI